jgi:hypothetical protein
MSSLTEKNVGPLLNFAVTGPIRGGTAVVQTSINNHPKAVCHGNLLSGGRTAEADALRRESHERYFGPSHDPLRMPEWYTCGSTNPVQYLVEQVWDNPLRGESAVGLCLPYHEVTYLDLCELFQERYQEGDFCVIHVLRNPVTCFVSYKQAQHSGLWACLHNAPRDDAPPAEMVDLPELVQFVNAYDATRRRINAACPDCLVITYKDLFLEYQATMRKVFEFLEIPALPLAHAGQRRLCNHELSARVRNWDQIFQRAPSEIKAYMTADDLF